MKESTQLPLEAGHFLQPRSKYEIKGVLGEPGGFGITYLAYFKGLNKQVAIKEYYPKNICIRDGYEVEAILPYQQLFDQNKNRFLEEARNLAKFDHKNIVRIVDVFEENNTAYFVMDYIRGLTLYELVRSQHFLIESVAIKYIQQVGHALEIAHNSNPRLLHRDIKPQNIIISESDEAILIDFGAAREIVSSDMVFTGILTHGFAPPEQYEPQGEKGVFIDIYALASTFYFCVTGTIPIPAPNRLQAELPSPTSLNPGISKGSEIEILKGLELDHNKRHKDISELTYSLSKITPLDGAKQYSLTDDQKNGLRIAEKFIEDPSVNVLRISGPEGSGKTFLIWKLLEIIRNRHRTAKIFAIGSRVAESLKNRSGLEVSSLYSAMYNFSDLEGGQSEIIDIAKLENDTDVKLEQKTFVLRDNHDDNSITYIIDEAQLLSDRYSENDLFKLGSGKLFSDFLNYASLDNNPSRKVILIGDPYQLLRGSKEETPMCEEVLLNSYSIPTMEVALSEQVSSEPENSIAKGFETITRGIDNKQFNYLNIDPDIKHIFTLKKTDFEETYRGNSSDMDSIVITYSNKNCVEINEYIRRIIFHKSDGLQLGDRVLLQNNISIESNGALYSLHQGEFGKVVRVTDKTESHIQPLKGYGRIVLELREVEVHFDRLIQPVTVLMLDDYLTSEERDIAKEDRIALLIKARKNIQEELGRSPNPTEIGRLLAQNKYLNAALLKYGYAITCHRAQGKKWNNVFINCETEERSKTNENYYRWLYTAMTCSSSKVFLLNAPQIFPWYKVAWKENTSSFDEFSKSETGKRKLGLTDLEIPEEINSKLDKLGFPSDKIFLRLLWIECQEKLSPKDIQIDNVEHKQFHEVYHFRGPNSEKVRVIFYYNAKGEISKRKLLPVNKLTQSIEKLLDQSEENREKLEFPHEFLDIFYAKFKKLLSIEKIQIKSVNNHQYKQEYTLEREKEFILLQIFYTGEGFISTVMPQKYNSNSILKDVKKCFEKLDGYE